ncbi:MAG: PIG-L family deacetylase [Chitinophagaceae bacterium]
MLYIAAHPDDENTRLLAYLANDRLYRTGYLSLTRGDGGQNLIGDEQGIELGLIRTQELLAARRIDGAEQFFTRAYDFGFSKNPEETFRIWDKEKILSDVVWVIRKFRPDIIICRFPATGEGGHGHHTASGILGGEAFTLAGDPTKFTEHFAHGVEPWQAKRVLWNSFNFGSTNTQRDDQFKVDAGGFNALLGKSYGELAAESRSLHKSQGFGVPRGRGSQVEFFATVNGEAPKTDLMDGVTTSWERIQQPAIKVKIDAIVKDFSLEHPEASVTQLVNLHNLVDKISPGIWRTQKLKEISQIIELCSGLYMEMTTAQPFAIQGDSLRLVATINNRSGVAVSNATVLFNNQAYKFDKDPARNVNVVQRLVSYVSDNTGLSLPYWLEKPLSKGRFDVNKQENIGLPENEPMSATFNLNIAGKEFSFTKPVLFKSNDPVKGELYQPVQVVGPVSITSFPAISVAKIGSSKTVSFLVKNYKDQQGAFKTSDSRSLPWEGHLSKGYNQLLSFDLGKVNRPVQQQLLFQTAPLSQVKIYNNGFKMISYDHIPDILVPTSSSFIVKPVDLIISGKKVGYIAGAGDKVPESIMQMGYEVVMLQQKDVTSSNLKQFDAVVTGVRAYNVHEWLNDAYDALMNYVKDGGVLLVQYNTSNNIGPVKAKISPYPFTIARSRITDEDASVNFIDPAHPVLNFPNKITKADFDGWVQERSVYNAEGVDNNYKAILSMKDPGEAEQTGGLIVSNYGKGKFVYSALAFFRQLPAGVTGAYRLFANLLAKP